MFLAEKREKKRKKENTQNRAQRDREKAAAHTRLPCRIERRAARRQHQHWFCSHRSAGNYDNNMFPRQVLFDSVSEHLPFLKSPPDNIWYDYKVRFLLRSAHLCASNFVYRNFPSLASTQCCSSSYCVCLVKTFRFLKHLWKCNDMNEPHLSTPSVTEHSAACYSIVNKHSLAYMGEIHHSIVSVIIQF